MQRNLQNLAIMAATLVAAHAGAVSAQESNFHEGVQPTAEAKVVEAKPSEKDSFTIGFSNISLVNTWRSQMVEEATYRASQFEDIANFIVTDAGGQANKQIADVEDLIARGVDALLVAPASETALNSVLDRAHEAGIPTIIFETNATPSNYTVKILADDNFFGAAGAEFLAEAMGGEGKIFALRGFAGMSVESARWAAVEEVLAGYENITIADAAFGDFSYDKGKQVCESLLIAHPDVDGVWSSGGAMTQACIEVFQENGIDLVPMTGESNNGFLKIWSETGIESIAPVTPTWVGAEAVVAAVKLLRGEEVMSDYIIRPEPITADKIDEYYQPDLNDSYWTGSILPQERLLEIYGK